MKNVLILLLIVTSISCSTVVMRYKYDEQGVKMPQEKIIMRGIGKVKSDGDKYEISGEPWVKLPSLPEINYEK